MSKHKFAISAMNVDPQKGCTPMYETKDPIGDATKLLAKNDDVKSVSVYRNSRFVRVIQREVANGKT